ncbi:MAG: flagellar hook-length control protein FliK [Pseudomonadota bacterium]
MNFTFTDVSSSILNMVQSELPQNAMLGAGNQDSKNQLFAQKLGKILEKGKALEDQALSNNALETVPEKSGKMVDFITEKLGNKKGVAFLSELKNIFLMLSKGDLKNFSIDVQGLETIKKLLSNAGFDLAELDELMAELNGGLEENKLTMDDLFDQLFELGVDTICDLETQPEQFIETSALPFVETILNALEIPQEKVQEILSAADKGDKGISLDVVIEKLQNIQKKAFYTHTQYQTQDGDDQFKSLLKQLGLETENSKPASLTLNDLVKSFEKMRSTLSRQNLTQSQLTATDPKAVATEKTADLVKDLFKGLEIQNMPKEKQIFEFSYDGVKNQFKNDLLDPENGKMGQKGLFSTPKPTKTELIKDGLKETASLLDEKGSKTSGLKEAATNGKEFVKHLKTRASALTDQSQVSSSDNKSSETSTNQGILKSTASFRNLPNFVTQQVSKSIVRAINQGENTLKIQLNPPELGRIMLTIDNTGNSMKVSIMTENAAAKDILVSNVNELRTVLSNSGVTLERFDVDMNSDFRQSMADAKNQENLNKRQKNTGKQILDPVNDILNSGLGLNLTDAVDQGDSLHFVA